MAVSRGRNADIPTRALWTWQCQARPAYIPFVQCAVPMRAGGSLNTTNTLTHQHMKTNLKYMIMALIAATAITACKKDKDDPIAPPPPPNEEEVITTLILSFDGQAGATDKELRFTDPDGDGGAAPYFDLDTLQATSNYTVSILVLNETAMPVDTISNEVLDEGVDHQFFFQPTGANITIAYADVDGNGNPIGLQTSMATGAASVGTLRVTLRHEPNKTAAGVQGGDITNAGGETDIEVDYPMVIE